MIQLACADYGEFLGRKLPVDLPTGIPHPPEMPSFLKDFQAHVVPWALRRGRAALFEDTGLGKSIQEIVWAHFASVRTGKPSLIFTPLAVAEQFVREGERFGFSVEHVRQQSDVWGFGVNVTNYERLHLFDASAFGAVAVDESSILANLDGKTRRLLNEFAAEIPFRLAASATPAPNDLVEIVNHAEFLGVMKEKEIKALFFTQDGNSSNKWRLKGHARRDFWRWVASWAVALRLPSDLGFSDEGYILPPLRLHEHVVRSRPAEGDLFVFEAQTLTERRDARRESIEERVALAVSLVEAEPDEAWLIWCDLNAESEALTAAIPGAVEVKGSDSEAHKEWALNAFATGEIKRLVTKPSIAGMGMNWQNSARAIFVGLSDSWRALYHGIRRQLRFGQTREVHAHLISSEAEGSVVANVRRKDKEHRHMMDQLVSAMAEFSAVGAPHRRETMEYRRDVQRGDGWDAYLGDSVEWLADREEFPDNGVGLWIFSPPFPGMYAYTNSPNDMGNVRDMGELVEHFRYLVPDLLRSTMPGRSCAIHLTQGVAFKGKDGYCGLHDFRGEVIRVMKEAGWIHYGEVVIDKNPQVKAVRTKDASLQFKSLANDSSRMRMALADYLIQFRKPGENPFPIRAGVSEKYGNPDGWITNEEWIRWARPVWYASDWMPEKSVVVVEHEDGTFSVEYANTAVLPGHDCGPHGHMPAHYAEGIRETDTLNVRQARETDDERHLAPLQLGVVERAVKLWTNPGEIVATPFGGIGTEGFVARNLGRRTKLVELKESYWLSLIQNVSRAGASSGNYSLLDPVDV